MLQFGVTITKHEQNVSGTLQDMILYNHFLTSNIHCQNSLTFPPGFLQTTELIP